MPSRPSRVLAGLLIALLLTPSFSSATTLSATSVAKLSLLASAVQSMEGILSSLAAILTALKAEVGIEASVAAERSPESLTLALLALKQEYASAPESKKAAIAAKMKTIVQTRTRALLALAKENPTAAVATTLPDTLIAQFPKDVQALLEQNTTIDGIASVFHEDDFDTNTSAYRYELKTKAGERLTLHFAGKAPHFKTGDTIRVSGKKAGDDLLVVDTTNNVALLAENGTGTLAPAGAATAVLPNTFGEQKTLVMLVNFQDDPNNKPWTIEQARSMVFGSASDFYRENSYGQTWLAGDVGGWYVVPANYGTECRTIDIAIAALNAATAAGFNVSSYAHRVYVFPYSTSCGFSGSGSIGGSPTDTWVNGNLTLSVLAHEMGHNFGLFHSHYLECGALSVGSDSECTKFEYGDITDTMGGANGVHYDTFQKTRLGWLDDNVSPPITTVTTSGTYMIGAYENVGSTPHALRIAKSTNSITGAKTWYTLEYRQPIGFDNMFIDPSTSINNVTKGLVLHLATENEPDSGFLIDTTASSTYYDQRDLAIEVGRTYSDPIAGLAITTTAASGTGATASVTLSAPQCLRQNPLVSVSPGSGYGNAGDSLTYNVAVGNADTHQCASTAFTVTSMLASGLTQSPSSFTVTLAPGTWATTSVSVTSSVSTPVGGYGISETATHNAVSSLTGSANATYWVQSAPIVDVTAPTVAITSPVNGATVPVSTVLTLSASASDNNTVSRVDFYLDGRNGKLLCSDYSSPYSCTWSVPKTKNRTYSFYAKAYDAAGNVGVSSMVTVTGK